MSRSFSLSTFVFAALSALLISSALSITAFAHSNGACVNHVVESCNAAHPNNYNARIACTNNGITACNSHTHGGGGNGVDSASNDYSADTGRNNAAIQRLNRIKRLKLRR